MWRPKALLLITGIMRNLNNINVSPSNAREVLYAPYQAPIIIAITAATPNAAYTPRYMPTFLFGSSLFAFDHWSSHTAYVVLVQYFVNIIWATYVEAQIGWHR